MYKRYCHLKSETLRFSILAAATALILSTFSLGYSQGTEVETPYCCAPPFVMETVKPNILFIMDMTGSMWWRASWNVNSGLYDSTRTYYGYFDHNETYYYKNNTFWKRGFQPPNSAGPFPGNIMNWAVMSRIDILRKVLVGGTGEPSSQWPKNMLEAQGYDLNSVGSWPCNLTYMKGGLTYQYRFSKPADDEVQIARLHAHNGADSIAQGTFRTNIDIPAGDPAGMGGVIRQICDKDLDGDFDKDSPRVALMFFSTYSSNFALVRGFFESDGPRATSAEAYMNDINNMMPNGGTPVAKAVLDGICYLSYVQPYYGTYIPQGRGMPKDPYYTGVGVSLQPVWCRKSFIILIGDGESNSDHVSVSNYAPLPAGPWPRPLYDYDNDNHAFDYVTTSDFLDRHHPADDYAYYGHITDLRPDLQGKQNAEFYSLFSFGRGAQLFKDIAIDGGFDDLNGDNIPQPNEYDKDGNGVPDHYYEAEEGNELEQAILQIVSEIMAKVSSSSGVSVLTFGTKAKAGGTTAQAQFYPTKTFPAGEERDWIGTCQSVWLDPFGNLREDTAPADAVLHLQDDLVINMQWSPSDDNVMITRYQDLFGNGDSLVQVGLPVPIEALQPVWDAGSWLWRNFNPPTDRVLWTSINGAPVNFDLAHRALLKPYLGKGLTDEQADTIIRYIRGEDIDTTILRPRTVDGMPWKLGDVVNSGPVVVSRPVERYDFIYGDASYAQYYDTYRSRRQVVYVGANDGMLHAFNAGVPIQTGDDPFVPMELNPAGYDLGEELWGYIPNNLLPHLRWLKDPTYGACHVYYVDLKAYVTDAQIFDSSAVHPGGWATVLIGGMRLGGTPIETDTLPGGTQDTCRSAYFALDVTDPEHPELLWEFTDPDLRYTVCYPTVVKVEDEWYLAFGSGPMTCGGDCSQNARLYIINLRSGNIERVFTIPDTQSFISNIFAADWGITYNVDRIYFGDCHYDSVALWGGKVYRILTHEQPDPNIWTMDMVMDLGRPITGEGSIATDEFNHLWVYFGTGRFYSEVDEVDTTIQVYVGFRDDTTHSTNPMNLLDVTNITVDTMGLVQPGDLAFDSLVAMVDDRLGWYREFPTLCEKNFTTSLVMGGAVLFTTFVPVGDICSFGGEGNLYALYYRTGTAYSTPFLGDTLGMNRIAVSLGPGMPSEPSLYVDADQTKVFIQVGGGIVSPETGIPGLPRSGVILWKGR